MKQETMRTPSAEKKEGRNRTPGRTRETQQIEPELEPPDADDTDDDAPLVPKNKPARRRKSAGGRRDDQRAGDQNAVREFANQEAGAHANQPAKPKPRSVNAPSNLPNQPPAHSWPGHRTRMID